MGDLEYQRVFQGQLSIVLLLLLCFSSAARARPLNQETLKKEKWYYSLDEALKEPEKVYKLNLADQKMKYGLTHQIGRMKNLQILNITACGLTSLPPELFKCKNLQTLAIYGNELTELPVGLQSLNNLEELFAGRNQLTELPRWLGGLRKLRKLEVTQNPLRPGEAQKIQKMLPNCRVTHQLPSR